MYTWELPTSLEVGGKEYAIRTDYRVILDILAAMNDPDIFEPGMTEEEKKTEQILTMLQILYIDFDTIPEKDRQEASERAVEFIDCGIKGDDTPKPRAMDWEQDGPIIAPEISKVAGKDIRIGETHWWEFFGYYLGIGEGVFSTIVNIREKRRKGKKLEKWEKEFYQNNKSLVDLKINQKERSDEEKEALRELFGLKK